jgi:hypothetical protein
LIGQLPSQAATPAPRSSSLQGPPVAKPMSGKAALLQLAPMVLSMFAARKNPQHAAALMQGLMKGNDAARAEQLDAQEKRQHRQETLSKMLSGIAADAQQIEDPAEFSKYLQFGKQMVDASFGAGASAPLDAVGYPATRAAKRAKADARAKLDALEKAPHLQGYLNTPQFDTFTATMDDGERVTVRDLKQRAGLVLADASGQAVAPKAAPKSEPAGTVAERAARLLEGIRTAKARGDVATASQLRQSYDDLLQAQREVGQADDRAPRGQDPVTAAIQALTLQNLQRNNAGEITPGQATTGNQLADNFRAESKDFMQVSQAFNRVKASAKDPSAAGDLALIFNYMKTLDPGSTVREGEFATAQNSGGIPERITAAYNRIINGERLAPAQRQDFLDRSTRLYTQALGQQKRIEEQYRKKAKAVNIPADYVITDYSVADDTAPRPAPPRVGERRLVNGQPGEWDGRGWKAVR